LRCSREPETRQRPRPDSEIDDEEAAWRHLQIAPRAGAHACQLAVRMPAASAESSVIFRVFRLPTAPWLPVKEELGTSQQGSSRQTYINRAIERRGMTAHVPWCRAAGTQRHCSQ